MKERLKVYFGIGSKAKKAALSPVRFDVIALVATASLAFGVIIGYIQTSGFELFSQASRELQRAVKSWAAEVTPDPAKSQPAAQLPPVRRAPPASPVLQPGPVVPIPDSPSASTSASTSTSSRGGAVTSAAAPVFRVQVGAFRIRANAESLVSKLSRDGFKASINQTSDLYKVQIGTFRDRKDATRLAARLKAKRYAAFVTRATTSNR
jgi:cell division protein FtsN